MRIYHDGKFWQSENYTRLGTESSLALSALDLAFPHSLPLPFMLEVAVVATKAKLLT